MNWTRDIAGVAEAMGLRRKGAQYSGPCICCGGNDRFHIQKGKMHPIVMHCRHGCSFAELAKKARDMGLVSEDDYDREQWRQQKHEDSMRNSRFALSVYESAKKRGEKMSYKDKLTHRNLKKLIEGVDTHQQ